MTPEYTGGTVSLANWQKKLAQRVGGLEPGCHLLFVTVTGGTVEPTWAIMASGKVENGH